MSFVNVMKRNALSSFADHIISQLMFLGLGLILWAVLFIIWPASFVYLVSAFFIIFGVLSIWYALKIRRLKKDMSLMLEKMMGQ